VLSYVENLIDDPAIEISFDRWDNVPPVAAYDGGGFEVIRQAIEAVYPQAVVTPSLLTATTDTRHYVGLADNQYRFHGVLIESSQASSVHGTNEFITVESFNRSIAIAREMLRLGSQ
jgi:carboxypeptidase PM20D1